MIGGNPQDRLDFHRWPGCFPQGCSTVARE
jgi:hypothetical protein